MQAIYVGYNSWVTIVHAVRPCVNSTNYHGDRDYSTLADSQTRSQRDSRRLFPLLVKLGALRFSAAMNRRIPWIAAMRNMLYLQCQSMFCVLSTTFTNPLLNTEMAYSVYYCMQGDSTVVAASSAVHSLANDVDHCLETINCLLRLWVCLVLLLFLVFSSLRHLILILMHQSSASTPFRWALRCGISQRPAKWTCT